MAAMCIPFTFMNSNVFIRFEQTPGAGSYAKMAGGGLAGRFREGMLRSGVDSKGSSRDGGLGAMTGLLVSLFDFIGMSRGVPLCMGIVVCERGGALVVKGGGKVV